ncbi:MAG: hypothetical protein Q4F49_03010 [Pseudoxanthomonas suwonensis]|nr:hypothetical protein [Pseudoxanthomonas suwonensis]
MDAWWLPAGAAPAHVAARERVAARAQALMQAFCISTTRCRAGSQDGEAVVGRDRQGAIIALIHLDPQDVAMADAMDDLALADWLRQG